VSYDRVASFLESELDRVEAAKPHIGKLPLAHRLSRTEYKKAFLELTSQERQTLISALDKQARAEQTPTAPHPSAER